jgi:hypothetical protein
VENPSAFQLILLQSLDYLQLVVIKNYQSVLFQKKYFYREEAAGVSPNPIDCAYPTVVIREGSGYSDFISNIH